MTQFMRAYPDVDGRSRAKLLRETNLPVPFVASTPGKKDDGIDLRSQDWNLDRFRNYPIILYGHDFQGRVALPIGLGENIRIEDSKLKIDIRYDEDDDFAMKCRSKAIKGMIAGSVSWNRKDGKNELLEFSNVNVGLDPDSLPEIERFAMRSMMDDLMEGMGGEGAEKLTTAIESLRQKVSEVMASLSEPDTREADEPVEEPVVEEPMGTAVEEATPETEPEQESRAIEFWDMTDQLFAALRSVVQEWFQFIGVFFEDGRSFCVISVDGLLWRYDFTVNEKEEVEIGEGFRTKYNFPILTNDEQDNRGTDMDEDDDPEKMGVTEDDTVEEEGEPDPQPVEEDPDEMRNEPSEHIRSEIEAILARADELASRNISEV